MQTYPKPQTPECQTFGHGLGVDPEIDTNDCIWSTQNLLPATTSQLSSSNRTHLLHPTRSGTDSLDGTYLIGAEPGNANVVLAFQDHLKIACFEGDTTTKFGEFACGCNELVDEFVSNG
jgi:hypothetical protein